MPNASQNRIEIAAQALRDHVTNRLVYTGRQTRPWVSLPETLRQQYRDEVQVVLDAAG